MSSSASKKRKFQKDNRESASRDSVVTTSADTDSNFKSKTKISIGQEIWRWCKLKSDRNLKSHCEVAKLLLDIYEVHTKKRIFPDLSEDDSDSSSVEDGSDDAQPPTATISKTPSEEASSSTGHNQIVQVKIETVDIHQEADPHIITELATARTSHIPLIVKTEYADPEQTFSEHGKIQVPGIPEACFPNKEEPPSEQDIKLQVPSNQTYALAPESFDSAIHIEHAVEEESENEAEVHDTQKMEVNAAMETAKNQSKSRSSRVKSRSGVLPRSRKTSKGTKLVGHQISRSTEYRRNLKATDHEAYQKLLQKDREYKRKIYTPVADKSEREKELARRRWRESKKRERSATPKAYKHDKHDKAKRLKDMTGEERRAYNRDKMRIHRAKLKEKLRQNMPGVNIMWLSLMFKCTYMQRYFA